MRQMNANTVFEFTFGIIIRLPLNRSNHCTFVLHIKSADVLTSLLSEVICALPTMTCASVRKMLFDLNVSIIITDASKGCYYKLFLRLHKCCIVGLEHQMCA